MKSAFALFSVLAIVLLYILLARFLPENPELPPSKKISFKIPSRIYQGVDPEGFFQTDPLGFRTSKPIDYFSKKGIRIFALGASTTEQFLLKQEQTWTGILEKILQSNSKIPIELINAGVSGIRAKHLVTKVKELLQYQPDIVLFFPGINDWNWHVRSHYVNQTWKGRILSSVFGEDWLSGNYLLRGRFQINVESFKPLTETELGEFQRRPIREIVFDQVLPSYERSVNAFAVLCQQSKVRCILLTQPTAYSLTTPYEVRQKFWMNPPSEAYQLGMDSLVSISQLYNHFLVDFGNRLGMEVCDLASSEKNWFKFLYDDVHFNIEGAKRFGESLAVCLNLIQ